MYLLIYVHMYAAKNIVYYVIDQTLSKQTQVMKTAQMISRRMANQRVVAMKANQPEVWTS